MAVWTGNPAENERKQFLPTYTFPCCWRCVVFFIVFREDEDAAIATAFRDEELLQIQRERWLQETRDAVCLFTI